MAVLHKGPARSSAKERFWRGHVLGQVKSGLSARDDARRLVFRNLRSTVDASYPPTFTSQPLRAAIFDRHEISPPPPFSTALNSVAGLPEITGC